MTATSSLYMRAAPAWLVGSLAVMQFIASGFSRITGLGRPVESISMRGGLQPPEVPAGYAFGIWFVIFSLGLAYAIWYATKGRDDSLGRAVSVPACVIFALSCLWMLAAQLLGDGWYLVFLILMMWAASMMAFLPLRAACALSTVGRGVIHPMLGLYAGWLSLAIFLNITATTANTFGTFGLTPSAYAFLSLLPAAALAGIALMRTKGDLWYAAAVFWGLHGIVVANLWLNTESKPLVAAAAGLLMALLAAVTFQVRRSR